MSVPVHAFVAELKKEKSLSHLGVGEGVSRATEVLYLPCEKCLPFLTGTMEEEGEYFST